MPGLLMGGPTFVVSLQAVSVSSIKTLIQIKAGSTVPLWLVRARITQYGNTTNAQERIQILRKTAAATVSSFTPIQINQTTNTAAAAAGGTTATGTNASAEGTDGAVLIDTGFSVLSGYEWIPTPTEQILVPAAGIIAMKFPVAPAAQVWTAQMYFTEAVI